MRRFVITITAVALCALALIGLVWVNAVAPGFDAFGLVTGPAPDHPDFPDTSTPEAHALAEAAMSQVGRTVEYDASYVTIEYPGGDVPIETGVCTDVVIRALRECGVDLQVEVHEDMTVAFDAYPDRWDLEEPDPNIDHRRVPNLQAYFTRHGMELPTTDRGSDYLPGDIVTWSVGGRPHIGVVSTQVAMDGSRFCVAHNIGTGTVIQDSLFRYEITGHYRWFS